MSQQCHDIVFRCVTSVAHFFILYNGRCNKYYFVIKGGAFMPDYKLLYLTLLDSVEKAINLLIDAQKACEDIYVDTDETKE